MAHVSACCACLRAHVGPWRDEPANKQGRLCGLEGSYTAPQLVTPPVCLLHPCSENVGAISITGVASRRVTQTGAVIMIIISVIGKFGALFASIPQAVRDAGAASWGG